MITTDNKDLAAARLDRIGQMLGQRRVIRVGDLCKELGVSAATARRDLAELDERGSIRRVHGGAVFVESKLDEPFFEDKTAIAAREKQRVAQAALKLIHDNDSVFLDGGSTVLALAHLLVERARLTVVTNSLRVAAAFASAGPRTILIGGELRRLSQTFVGPLTQPMIDQLHVDTAFMGTIGISENGDLTTTDPREAQTKSLVIAHARQAVLLADSSKIGKVSFVRFASAKDLDVIVTDSRAGQSAIRALKKKGIKVLAV